MEGKKNDGRFIENILVFFLAIKNQALSLLVRMSFANHSAASDTNNAPTPITQPLSEFERKKLLESELMRVSMSTNNSGNNDNYCGILGNIPIDGNKIFKNSSRRKGKKENAGSMEERNNTKGGEVKRGEVKMGKDNAKKPKKKKQKKKPSRELSADSLAFLKSHGNQWVGKDGFA